MAITDRLGLPPGRSLVSAVAGALAGGADVVQVREKDLSDAELAELARELRALTRAHGAKLLVNGRTGVALAVDADGVHLPSTAPDVHATRAVLGSSALVGVSTHSLAEVEAACATGADYVMFGPVYATPSKAAFGAPLGMEALCAACDAAFGHSTVFAIGGITPQRAREVAAAGARVAAISALLCATDPAGAAVAFMQRMATSDRPAGCTTVPAVGNVRRLSDPSH